MASRFPTAAFACVFVALLCAQTRSVIGTVTAIDPATAELKVKSDDGSAHSVKLSSETLFRRIAPGEKDLKNAQPLEATALRTGDRVLVTLVADGTLARRVVVMSADDITRRNEADREDWNKRGVAGVVDARNGREITVRKRGLQGAVESVVTVTDKTIFRRYAPDSVKFADAKPSNASEIRPGDQLRARGLKSEDGLKVTADEVVFGTFLTKAGTISSIDTAGNQITVADLYTKKPFTIRLTADSQIKKMPGFSPAGGPGGPPMAGGQGAPPFGGGMRGPGPGRAGGPPDLAQMLERMPPTRLDDLKPGDTIVVSSTKGARESEITAIMLVANADMLIRIATMQSNSREQGQTPTGPGMGMPQMGLTGLDLGSIMP